MTLERLSVVMPTYKRPVYALRNMHLLDQTGARVHVLDGSPEPIDPALRSGLSSRINYSHLPVSYEERMARAVDLVDTPFCVSLADDDIHLPSGLRASVRALNDDSGLVAATGTALAVLAPEGDRNGRTVDGKLMYDGLHGRTVSGDDPVDRMVSHLANYLPSTVYAVTRTPTWQRAIRAVTGRRFRPVRIGELQYEMVVAYEGRSMVVPHLMWLRSSENAPHWAADDAPLAPWWEQAADSGERDEFASYMGRALTDDADKQPAASQGALLAVDAYVRALEGRAELRRRLTPTERLERWPSHAALPLTEWGRQVAELGVVVDQADLDAAVAAIEATPEILATDLPAAWTGRQTS